jgi:hypothetical protein
MNVKELQQWLVAKGQPIAVDGKAGPATRAAIVAAFSNLQAGAVSLDQVTSFAARLGASVKQLRAVDVVESGGWSFDHQGRPRILFERHIFWRLTAGRFGKSVFSDPQYGGYSVDSWDKLTRACAFDPDAAFASCSWGRFQVLGTYWHDFGYPNPLALAYSTVESEGAHYDLFCRYIEHFGLEDELRALSSNPADCRAFAKAYNGPAYDRNRYDVKLAQEMAK